uniref:Uncharacterized protein n=1 Tax=Bionectria ochroleuca TaxID=29856 RepID=A0A8H7K157_BIOOC
MVSACAGLVTVDEESNIIRLVHYTMQEYFSRNRRNLFTEGEESMAKTCVTYLSFSVFSVGPCKSDQALETRLEKNLLYDYAARNWGYHAQKSSVSTKRLILKCLTNPNLLSASCQAMLAVKLFAGDSEYARRVPGRMTAVHVAAHFGLSDIIRSLVGIYEIDSRNSHGRTPLSLASEHGHNNVVTFLLEKEGIDINIKDTTHSRSPLSWAAGNGHFKVCQNLLARDRIQPDSRASGGQTPLSWAAGNGHANVVRLLLRQGGVSPDSKATWWNKGRTPLLQAAANNHESVVQLLVDSGRVHCDSKDDDGRTPLSYMAQHGWELISKQVLSRDDVNPDCMDKSGRTPLSWAAQYGQEALVKMLLANNQVNPNSCDGNGFSPLIWAVKQGHEMVVRLLLEKGMCRRILKMQMAVHH